MFVVSLSCENFSKTFSKNIPSHIYMTMFFTSDICCMEVNGIVVFTGQKVSKKLYI